MDALDRLLRRMSDGDVILGDFVRLLLVDAQALSPDDVAARLPRLLAAYAADTIPRLEISDASTHEFAMRLHNAIVTGPLAGVDPHAVVSEWTESLLKPRKNGERGRVRVSRVDDEDGE